jgi:hypothetical protein
MTYLLVEMLSQTEANVVRTLKTGIAIVFAVLLLAAACLFITAMLYGESSAGAILASGRCVAASGNSWYLSLTTSGETATIQLAGRTIVVAPTSVQVDGRSVASLPATAKLVTVDVQDGEITLTADEQRIDTRRF